MDVAGHVLTSFTDVDEPTHLSSDSEGHVLVADCYNDRVLLLSSQLQLQRVLVDVDLQCPTRLSYDELTSQLCVVHGSSRDIISVYSLR